MVPIHMANNVIWWVKLKDKLSRLMRIVIERPRVEPVKFEEILDISKESNRHILL